MRDDKVVGMFVLLHGKLTLSRNEPRARLTLATTREEEKGVTGAAMSRLREQG